LDFDLSAGRNRAVVMPERVAGQRRDAVGESARPGPIHDGIGNVKSKEGSQRHPDKRGEARSVLSGLIHDEQESPKKDPPSHHLVAREKLYQIPSSG